MSEQLATSLIPGDTIVVTMSARKPDGSPFGFGATFDSAGAQIAPTAGGRKLNLNGSAGSEPTFNTAEYTRLVKANQKLEADQLTVAYKQAVDAFRNAGGGTLQDRIANAVLAWAEAEHNVRTTDHDGPVVKPEQIVVKPVKRAYSSDAGVFIVMLSPTWGTR